MFAQNPIIPQSNPTITRTPKPNKRGRTAAILLAAVLGGASALFSTTPSASAQEVPVPVQAVYVPRGMDDLKQLAAPIALYPDAVLADVLTASTYPQDVLDASQYLNAGNDPNAIDQQGWDSSVKGVARYPDVLNYLAGNPDWMNNLGAAFLNQPGDVMNAVQVLRAEANAAGNLVSNDQQRVICDGSLFEIVPANPQVIYVPVYDPAVVYVYRPRPIGEVYIPCVEFRFGVQVGGWLDRDCDWHDHTVYVGSWGSNRPWWHRDLAHDGVGVNVYVNDRPGNFRDAHVTNVTRITNVQTTVWQHDARKPVPRPSERVAPRSAASVRPVVVRPNQAAINHPAQRPQRVEPARVPQIVPVRAEQTRTVLQTRTVQQPRPVPHVQVVQHAVHPAPQAKPEQRTAAQPHEVRQTVVAHASVRETTIHRG